jgi:hypothetical protein
LVTAESKLVDLVGPSFARNLLHGSPVTPRPQMGLVNRALPDEVEKFVKDYADTISGNAPLTVTRSNISSAVLKDERTQSQTLHRLGGSMLRQQRLC